MAEKITPIGGDFNASLYGSMNSLTMIFIISSPFFCPIHLTHLSIYIMTDERYLKVKIEQLLFFASMQMITLGNYVFWLTTWLLINVSINEKSLTFLEYLNMKGFCKSRGAGVEITTLTRSFFSQLQNLESWNMHNRFEPMIDSLKVFKDNLFFLKICLGPECEALMLKISSVLTWWAVGRLWLK